MDFHIERLKQEEWENYPLEFEYETNAYYDLDIAAVHDGFTVTMEKKPFETMVKKKFTDKLFPAYFENQEAYGIVKDAQLAAVISISKEGWSNRLRVTELLVCNEYRRQGIGKKLMDMAKHRAKELKCRSIILETQSCNHNAIQFYFSQGFSLFGFDKNCYSNNDVEKREVRLELGLLINPAD